ncbi:glucosyltransferase domain-containing protein [Pantoea eucrina]|uniref:glucosyltransferase domain-containing protein n=1 Tax=Pantoea eucrina TaxID=472693 RepID=UPI0020267BAA|nr:glucosyltransferase domain-containing protein [Pantoea eucrina]MCL9645474.1 glucosyltransferase domain-containing protein [Pantoea eucrina]
MKTIKYKYYLIALLFLSLPIFLSSQYYIDDMGRATKGYTRWGVDGRPISDWLMQLISFNHRLIDTFPLPLILSCLLIAFALYMFHKKYIVSGGVYFIVPLGYLLTPSLPEVLSYRFDVLPMCVSLCAPLLLISANKNHHKFDFLFSSVTVLVVFCTYQPSINLYIFCSIIQFMYVIEYRDEYKHALMLAASRILALALSAFLYLKIILPNTFSGSHNSSHPGIDEGGLLSNAINNITTYYKFIDRFFFHGIAAFYFLLAACLILLCCIKLARKKKNTNKGASLIFIYLSLAILPFVSLLATMASLLPLESAVPYFSRLYVGFGGLNLLSFYCFYLLIKNNQAKYLTLLLLIPVTYFTVYVYAFGAASKAQSEYTSVVINDIKNSLRGIDYNYIAFNGSYAKSPVLLNSESNFPIFKFNIPNYFYNWSWPYNRFKFEGLYLPKVPDKDMVKNALSEMCTSSFTQNERLFDIHIVKDIAIIDFSKTCK